MSHDENIKPVPISELGVIFHEVLVELSNKKNKLIRKGVEIEE